MCERTAGRRNAFLIGALAASLWLTLHFQPSVAAFLRPRGRVWTHSCFLQKGERGTDSASPSLSQLPCSLLHGGGESLERHAWTEVVQKPDAGDDINSALNQVSANPSAATPCAPTRLLSTRDKSAKKVDANCESRKLRVFPVLLAGGVGRRFGGAQPKQFVPLLGKADAASISLSKLYQLGRSEGRLSPPEFVAVVAHEKFRKRFSAVFENRKDRLAASTPPRQSSCSSEENIALERGLVFANPGGERWESSWNATELICQLLLREADGRGDTDFKRKIDGCHGEDSPTSRRRRAEFYLRCLDTPQTPSTKARSSSEESDLFAKEKLLRRTFVLFHDAARPCFSVKIAEAAVLEASLGGASVVCENAKDTLKLADENGVYAHLPRPHCFHAQTPQVLRLDLLLRAFAEFFRLLEREHALISQQQERGQLSAQDARALGDVQALLSSITDDVSLLQLLPRCEEADTAPVRVKICIAPSENPKLTLRADMQRAEQALQKELTAGEAEAWQSLLQEAA